jgi:uncharacterized protein (DUF362 family)
MQKVAVIRTEAHYPTLAPYHPSETYPEYPFPGHLNSEENNNIYKGIRELFYALGLDREHFGTKDWNPLGFLIKPGMTVVLKPNFVLSRHKEGKDLFAIITHPSVLRAIADYVWIALKGKGKIIIADAPQYDCNFQELITATKLNEVAKFYSCFSGPTVEIRDLRKYWSPWKHFSSLLKPLPGDPEGFLIVNLGKKSALYGKSNLEMVYGAVYHRSETIAHHRGEVHEYEVSRTIMNADVVISVPKLKVHKKVGVTLNVKGLVGICTNKNYLVHYTLKPPSKGGDQYPDGLFNPLEELLIKTERWMYDHFLATRNLFLEYLHRSIYWLHNHTTRRLGIKVDENKRLLDAGNWYGNDSAWRMAVDLMRVFHFADKEGKIHTSFQRRVFSIIDGIIGGDNKGPLEPDPVPSGVLIGGENFLAVDLVATRLMGFDPLKVRMYQELLSDPEFDFGVRSLEDIEVISNEKAWENCLKDRTNRFLDFKPHPGWIGHLEILPKTKTNF